jgi:hypothetical protein
MNIEPATKFVKSLSLTGKLVAAVVLALVLAFGYVAIRGGISRIANYFDSQKIEKIEIKVDDVVEDANKHRAASEEAERAAEATGVAASQKGKEVEQAKADVRSVDRRLQQERERYAIERQRAASSDKDLTQLKRETCARLSRLGFECF